MRKILSLIFVSIFLYGCETTGTSYNYQGVQNSLLNSQQAQTQISLGASRSDVVSRLSYIESSLPPNWKRPPEQYIKDGKTIYIHYQRTGHVPDNRNTDDEFTPYVFENEKLIAIGWNHLGGPKVVSSGASSGMGGTVTINDPVRDSNALIKRGQDMMSGACTLGINC